MKRKPRRPPELRSRPNELLGDANYARVIEQGRRAKLRHWRLVRLWPRIGDLRGLRRYRFQLEAVSARAYILDHWLRHYLTCNRVAIPDKATLGILVGLAGDRGLDPQLLSDIQDWVNFRNEALHNLHEGRVAYDDLSSFMFDRHPDLHVRLERWVVQQVGAR